MSADKIYHMAMPDDWSAAKLIGEYRVSTRGATLDDVGFVHCSYPNQLAKVANFVYADVPELIVLEIDPELLDAEVKVEPGTSATDELVPHIDDLFPHIYGPVPVTAVVDDFWWERSEDGMWHKPPRLS